MLLESVVSQAYRSSPGGGGGEVVLNKSLYVIDIHRTV